MEITDHKMMACHLRKTMSFCYGSMYDWLTNFRRCWCFYTFLFLSTVLLLATPFGTSADTFSGISGGNLGGSLGENFGGSEWIDTLGGSSAQLFVENNLNGSRGYGPVDYLVTLQCWLTKPR
ncbi:hypothetical protein RhiirA1_389127 [Rhizophagus irregularis]|uniref:Uncharacterized protein n=2 Tax=Rhizophagus irregularis TaxID=588596 RepID=A0A2N0SCF1_9GLOM|nr:hypothetical protein GLOIN_2v1482311 [Rhizophagus irregularis DAOM 181602=DAOM 197198]PKC73226.1 hypothetical protein RhiirA1_389127 [Rhizophagus irregularis]POG66477.1 hypothetical protein GLOIN_2v1482311 [Rhizophagus irregularis DAOM 181602=DAOM 197198]|eukprot:XP_025173343.1 hypothetical protein GLOIN_2v1482311 [Rhizophagus irregularis DAOM 181602=DAOM 197198]